VLNLREAAKQLPERSAKLMSSARQRAEELTGVARSVKTEQGNISSIVASSRAELCNEFKQVRVGLVEEEKALCAEVQRCSGEVTEILEPPDHSHETVVREAQALLRRHHGAGDAIHSLNAFVKLTAALATPLASKDTGIGIDELKAQLQRGFDARLASIASLTSQIENLSKVARPSPPTVHQPRVEKDVAQRISFGSSTGWGSEEADIENRKPVTPYFHANSLPDSVQEQPGKVFGSWTSPQDACFDKPLSFGREAVPPDLGSPAPVLVQAGQTGSKRTPAACFGGIGSFE
jgi:hypothetical protein